MSSGTQINHDQSQPNSCLIGVWTTLFAVVLIVVCLGSFFYFQTTVSSELNKKEDTPMSYTLKKLRVYEAETLSKLAWKDKRAGMAIIPIDAAMDLTVSEYKR